MQDSVVSVFKNGKKEEDSVRQPNQNKLMVFLLGTIRSNSPVRHLRGQRDVLRTIWVYACSEWWSLHFHRYKYPEIRGDYGEIDPPTRSIEPHEIVDLREYDGLKKTSLMDCPAAIIATDLSFPPANDEIINVNMMPFDLFHPKTTLPEYLHGYIPLIEKCVRFQPQPDDRRNTRIAYLTVDERPAVAGEPQRRGGVHVESPGALRAKEIAEKSQYTPDLSWYHRWGLGSVDGEYVIGGIYLASNMADTTAIWNCRVHDTYGDIIAPHGSLERCREVLGPATRTLAAGELMWISDRTPHESLPVLDTTQRRQFFRLVVGEISYWFTEHNTPNPTGYAIPSSVTVVQGNKFEFTKQVPIVWECGSREELEAAKREAEFRSWLYHKNLGFLMDELRSLGIHSKEDLAKNFHRFRADLARKLSESGQYSSYTIDYILDSIFRLSGL
jgi:hypothetical protein